MNGGTCVLALNPGSETFRAKVVEFAGDDETVRDEIVLDHVDTSAAAAAAARAVATRRRFPLAAIGCRIVHGGERFSAPVRVTSEVLEQVRRLAPLAPLHVPTDLAVVEAAMQAGPGLPVVAVFDTAFHRTLPEVARCYALPADVGAAVRRFGFHGIAHQYVAGELLRRLRRGPVGTRLLSIHLGGGASACAIAGGQSIDTSMGMTPLEGLVMATRCGDLDPGIVLHLLRGGWSAEALEDLLYRRSGLAGISGQGGDLRVLEPAAARGDPAAQLALDIQAYRVRRYIGAYAAVLGGLDAIGLSGALAEHRPGLRERILRGLAFLGIRFDAGRNRAAGPADPARLDAGDGGAEVWLIPADEERQIAREVRTLLG